MATIERRGIRELIGVAVNASDLSDAEPGVERPLHRVAALGCVGFVRSLRDFRVTSIHPSGRLGVLLLRLKYGMQRDCAKPAMYLLAADIRSMALRQRWRLPNADAVVHSLLLRFAGALIAEWLHEVCPECAGRGRIAFGEKGERLRIVPRGTPVNICRACRGTGRRKVTDAMRAVALGVDRSVYARHWERRWALSMERLDRLDGFAAKETRNQLERA